MDFLAEKGIFEINREQGTVTPKIKTKRRESIDESLNKIIFKGKKYFIIGIAGGPASGKSKIAKYIKRNLCKSEILEEKDFFNFDIINKTNNYNSQLISGGISEKRNELLIKLTDPGYYDVNKFYDTLKKFCDGEKITVSNYDEKSPTYHSSKEKQIDPSKTPIIIVEGYFVFRDPRIREMIQLKIFNEIDDDVRLLRLILRENEYLNSNPTAFKAFFNIYERYIKQSYEKDIVSSKKFADIIVPDFEVNIKDDEIIGENALDLMIGCLKQKLGF